MPRSINDSKCILVTGATSGIGRALARSLRALPSNPKVIAAGRRQDRLDELAQEGFETIKFDLDATKEQLKTHVDEILTKYHELDAVLFCAGIQRESWFDKPETTDIDAHLSEINVNYVAIVLATTFFLPHFHKLAAQGRPSWIINVTSGLALFPAPWIAHYSATKAALHSFSISLYAQLKDTNVNVMEIIPPLVESELHDHEGTTGPLSRVWMPLDQFTAQTMAGMQEGKFQIHVGLDDPYKKYNEEAKVEAAMTYLGFRNKMEK